MYVVCSDRIYRGQARGWGCGVARCLGGAAEIGWQTKRVWVLHQKNEQFADNTA